MKLLVTGRDGQVARSLLERAAGRGDVAVEAVGRPDLDLCDPASVGPAIRSSRPDLVVSAAAYTAVDQAEDEPELAFAVNAAGAGAVAEAAAALGIPVLHLSTDYVFPGTGSEAYAEGDAPAPTNVYGRTKLEGEQAVARANPRHLILRTAWVYSPFGKNFVKTMLRLAAGRDEVSVVADQWGNPTSALDIADGILAVAPQVLRPGASPRFGTYHLAGTGTTSWAGFAEEIFAASRAAGGPSARVKPIGSAEFPTRASRPANSRLSTDKLSDAFGWRAPDWRESTQNVVRRLLAETPA